MRVRIIDVGNTTGDPVNRIFASLRDKEHETNGSKGIRLTSDSADVVHVMGPWTRKTCHAIDRQRQRDIPVVYTCTDALQSIANLRRPTPAMKKIMKSASTIHVSGQTEQQQLEAWFPITPIALILNPLLTASTTEAEAMEAFSKLYEQVIKSNQEQVRENIKVTVGNLKQSDENIAELCRQVLYAQHFYLRGFLPKPLLDDLTALLTTRDYDESQFAGALESLKSYTFAARLMHILRQTTQLTEGFMPIAELADKEAQAALGHILTPEEGLWWA